MNEIVLNALSQQINQSVGRVNAGAVNVKSTFIEYANEVIKCGLLLDKSKEEVGHGGWESWIKENINLSREQADLYIRCYNNYPQGVKSIEEIRGATNLKQLGYAGGVWNIPEGFSSKQIARTDKQTFTDYVIGFTKKAFPEWHDKWEEELKIRPLSAWRDDDRSQTLEQIKPLYMELKRIYELLS
jgi:hypothetical protein